MPVEGMNSRRLASGLALVAAIALGSVPALGGYPPAQPVVQSRHVPLIKLGGLVFRDLDRDGRLTPFEDWRLAPEARAADLVSRMTLAEKAGAMMHSTLIGIGSIIGRSSIGYDLPAIKPQIVDQHITSFITRLSVSPREMAAQNNAVQEMAEQVRGGIPVTVSTDPRHHFEVVVGASNEASGYSQWPESLGFASLRDPALMRRFADIARREYRLTGIQQALSPQADLFTEPRWPRGTATFGSNPELSRQMVEAYVEGFQGGRDGVTRDGVLTVVKHWVAYGATPQGWDGHNSYGRYAKVDAGSFPIHVKPFEGAFAVKVGGVMPTYSIVQGVTVDGKPAENVAAGFNRELLHGLLRGRYGFKGIVLSDWAITTSCNTRCSAPTAMEPQRPEDIAMPWGVEGLSPLERYAKAINAGVDQFGGVYEPQFVIEAVKRGLVPEARVDEAARRIMASKFAMGLFENPYADPDAAERIVGNPAVRAEAERVQAQAQILLKNQGDLLPLRAGTRVYLKGVDAAAARAFGLVPVDRPADAQVALVRASTPHEVVHPHHFFGSVQHEGRLDFRPGDADHEAVASVAAAKLPVVLALFADRPAVLTRIEPMIAALLVNFGLSDAALLKVVTGRELPKGRLPFELPSSMAAVEAQDPARPDDSAAPLYPFGAGLDMARRTAAQ
jgi:beta-glucosidase